MKQGRTTATVKWMIWFYSIRKRGFIVHEAVCTRALCSAIDNRLVHLFKSTNTTSSALTHVTSMYHCDRVFLRPYQLFQFFEANGQWLPTNWNSINGSSRDNHRPWLDCKTVFPTGMFFLTFISGVRDHPSIDYSLICFLLPPREWTYFQSNLDSCDFCWLRLGIGPVRKSFKDEPATETNNCCP